jgi:hypothetical protein
MIDKPRHRLTRAPHGAVPNWVLVVMATAALLATTFAQAF